MTDNIKVPDWVDREEYPWTPKAFETPAGKMSYLDVGEGPPIVMVHGNPTWSFVYRKLIKKLSENYRCIVPDHIGFGLSDKPYDYLYEPAAHRENLWFLLDELKLENITMIGQDWGGPIGIGWAAENPDRVDRVVILNTWAWPVDDDPHFIDFSKKAGGAVGRFLIKRFNFFANVIMKKAMADPDYLTPEIHDHYKKPLDTPESRKGCWVFPKQIIASTQYLQMVERKLPRLDEKPALICWGMKDIAFKEKELKRFQKIFPDAETITFDNAGHFPQEEVGEEVAEAIAEFMKKDPNAKAKTEANKKKML